MATERLANILLNAPHLNRTQTMALLASFAETTSFTVVRTKNGEGDYGVDEEYWIGDDPILLMRTDGALTNFRCYDLRKK